MTPDDADGVDDVRRRDTALMKSVRIAQAAQQSRERRHQAWIASIWIAGFTVFLAGFFLIGSLLLACGLAVSGWRSRST